MKGASYALLAVAGAVWPLVVPPHTPGSPDLRERVGSATDLGARGRFEGVRHRRSGPPALPELRVLARRSDEDLGRSRAPGHLASAALVRAAAGQTELAIELLEEAASVSDADAGLSTDLAALYLVRSASPQARPGDAARALQRSGEALALRPSDAARYNRAAALESLGLVERAQAGWREYIEHDRGSPWRADAISRLARLRERERPGDAATARESLARATETPARVAEAVAREPMQARLLVEEELLGRWARAEASGDTALAQGHLATARSLAAALASRQGDGLLAASVAAIDRAAPGERAPLAAGHRAYQDGIDHMARDEWGDAAAAFAESERLLGGRSPFAACAALQSGVCAYYRPDYPAALGAFERAVAGPGAHPLLRARASWLSGLVHFVTGGAFEALREHQEARAIFERAGERAHTAFLDSMLAADLQALGRRDQAWESRARALAALDQVAEPRRIFSVLWEGARVALDEGQPWTALDFLSELVERRELIDEPVLRASTLVRRARIAQRVGDWPTAAADAAEVRRLLPRVPQPLAGRLEVDVRVAEAENAAGRDPAAAVRAYSLALDYLDRAGNELQSATLRRARAASQRTLGRFAEAEQDLEWVLRSFETGRIRVADESQRIAFFDLLGGARDELVALYLDSGRPWRALEAVERTRARSLLSRVGTSAEPLSDVRAIQARLPPGSALLELAALDDRLVGWVITPETAGAFTRPMRIAEVEGLVGRVHRAIRGGDSSTAMESLARLHEALLDPVRAQLAGVDTLFVVPDKALHGVPFAALVDRVSRRYLAEDVAVVSVPGAAVLLQGAAREWPVPRRVLVVLRDEPQPDWPALPAARDEARRVAASYHDSHVLADDVATPRHVLERLDAIDVLHVAAHAVAGRDPRQTGLLLRADTGDGNALLSAEDLDRLAHTGRPRVAVLASCRTAEGAASLEGPLSLARGFLALGTSAVIASLWDLPDAASARLVPALHRRLADGVAPARALREVQLEAIRAAGRDADPIGWASLVVVGNLASASRRAPGETTRTSVYSRSGG